MGITEFFTPETVEEAEAILADRGASVRVLAGGTDLMLRMKRGMLPGEVSGFLSLHRVASLRGVREAGAELVVGAATTAADLVRDERVRDRAPILAIVADRLASQQIRNRATVGGDLANASPAGDLINPLLLLDARVVLEKAGGEREVPVEKLFTGPGETVREPDELLTAVRFAVPAPERVFRFEKAGTRPAMECSVVTVGVAWTPSAGKTTDVRVAFGSSAPVPLRGLRTEAALEGAERTDSRIEEAAAVAREEVSPISDVRGSAAYRRALVAEFLRRLLHD